MSAEMASVPATSVDVPATDDPGKLRREAAGLPIVPALDGFRALAVMGIVFVHVVLFAGTLPRIQGTILRDALIIPSLGVDTLFVVSGFVMFLPTAARRGSFGNVKQYALRRAARLFPAAWVVLALVVLLLAVYPPSALIFIESDQTLAFPGLYPIVGHLLLLQTPIQFFDLSFPRGLGIIGPIWTLSLELIFYSLLPLIAAAWYRRPWLWLTATIVVSVGWHLAFQNLADLASLLGREPAPGRVLMIQIASDYQFPAYAASFGAGMTAAYLYVRLPLRFSERSLSSATAWLQPLALVAAIGFAVLAVPHATPSAENFAGPAAIGRNAPLVSVGFSLSVALLMLATAYAPWRRQALVSNRGASWLADSSYGIYLIHYPILAYMLVVLALPQNGTLATLAVWTALTFALAIGWGWLSARWIERPARRWAHLYRPAKASSRPVTGEIT